MTRKFVDDHIIAEMAQGGVARGGLGRGGTREIVNRLFVEGAGFPPPGLVSKKTDAIASAATSVVSSARNTAHEQPTTQLSFSEHAKRYASERLCELIESNSAGGGNESTDRILTDAWAEYPLRDFNDDSFLSKPDAAYEWLYFHDVLQARVFANQDWELARYLAHPVVACHHLFASPRETMAGPSYLLEQQNQTRWGGGRQNQLHDDDDDADGGVDGRGNGKDGRPLPFSGPGADFAARAAERDTRAALQALQASLSPSLARAFRGPEDVAVGLLPWLVRMVSPDVKPVVVGGHPSGGGLGASGSDQKSAAVTSMASVRKQSEKIMVRRAAEILADFGVELVKGRLEDDGRWGNRGGAWVYRLEP